MWRAIERRRLSLVALLAIWTLIFPPARAGAGESGESGESGGAGKAGETGKAGDPAAGTDRAPQTASASETRHEQRVPLKDNFPITEQIGIWSLVAVDVTSAVLEKSIVAHLGGPWIGTPFSLDVTVSNALYRGASAGRYLWGAPDIFGNYVAPGMAILGYGANAVVLWVRGRPFIGGVNADHKFLGLAEAYGVTLGLTTTFKYLVGRQRPLYALNRIALDPTDPEGNLSFFSGHTSSSFCLAAFVSRDFSDRLVHDVLAGRSPTVRFWVGRVVPAALLYGTAGLVGYSRIVDQRHFLTDVLTGAVIGSLAGNLVYSLHFDKQGRPRQAGEATIRVGLAPFPSGMALSGTF